MQPKKCPECGKECPVIAWTFVERGTWDGSTYEHEGEFPTYGCDTCDIEFTIANKLTEEQRRNRADDPDTEDQTDSSSPATAE